jgi:hypothetical protein
MNRPEEPKIDALTWMILFVWCLLIWAGIKTVGEWLG